MKTEKLGRSILNVDTEMLHRWNVTRTRNRTRWRK